MPVDQWIVQDYSAYEPGIKEVDALVHYLAKQAGNECIVAVKKTPGTDVIYATSMAKPSDDYTDYKTKYIDTERSIVATNSVDAEIKLNDAVLALSSGGKTYEELLIAVDSPVEISFNTDMGKNSKNGYVTNDGPGDIVVRFSEDGVTYGSEVTMKNNETISWDSDVFEDGLHSIRLIHTGTDSTYRIFAV